MSSPPALLAGNREQPFQRSFCDKHNRETSPSHTLPARAHARSNSNAQCEGATVDSKPRCRRPLQQRRQLPKPRVEGSDTGPRLMQPTANASSCTQEHSEPTTLTSTFHSLTHTRPICRSPITETQPAHVSWLWNEVMSYASDTRSSRGRKNGKTASTTSRSGILVDTPSASEAGTRARKEAAAKVSDADFANTVLKPCGIEIDQQDVNKNLRIHFRREHLPTDAGGRLKDYQKEYPLENVWLEPDMERIRTQYRSMGLYGSNEAEYSAYALRDIFVDEPLQPWLPEERGDEMWLPVRLLQFVQKPPDDKWLAPPLLTPSQKRYAWDIRPDCAYYVSLQAFQSGFRPNVRSHVAVRQKRAFCSYLTIEFKKADDDTIITARHQVATASAIALYNRYLLKLNAIAAVNGDKNKLEQEKREWHDSDKHQMRHYGITFTGSTWDLWCTVPKTLETWTGCIMSKIYSGDCSIHPGPARLVGIVNDIHYWGLHVHGRSCKNDIADKVHADADADTDDITFFEEDRLGS
ncbi:hypothetical protein P154DRAFT_572960 [Amniculicola lignicola CBS 123094]|uniref:Uncharacterized protein n=1 Tax=Amniculicola lignicola CBS 123094 TaxID=1392246 RepID=A0A6A5WPE1_9PLEO|nr:hypothetical protein P154DRAFT_572960 [Amniculicola lignicola CBS 123094]